MGIIQLPLRVRVACFEFDRTYKAYINFVKTRLKGCGVREDDLEDIAQDVFITAWVQRERFDPRWSMATWLNLLCRNKSYTYHSPPMKSDPKNEVYQEDAVWELEDGKSDPERRLLESEEFRALLLDAIKLAGQTRKGPKRALYMLWISQISWEELE
jgi:DNA-directed RNA polymerase specialized sigma24 family protein